MPPPRQAGASAGGSASACWVAVAARALLVCVAAEVGHPGSFKGFLGVPPEVDDMGMPEEWGRPTYSDTQPEVSWRDLSAQGRLGAICDPSGNIAVECGKGLVCRGSVCRHCREDHECPSLNKCRKSLTGSPRCEPVSRKAWELAFTDPWEAFCTFLILLAATLSAAAGTGGGGIFVPVLISFSTLKAENAVPLSQCMCLCGAVVNVGVFVSRRHPEYFERPVIDYDCIMLFAPMLFLGVTLGVIVNQMSPQWLLLVLLVMTLGSALWRTGGKGLKQLRQENALRAKMAAQMERQVSKESKLSQVLSEAGDVVREYLDQVAELTNDSSVQIVGLLVVWILMLVYSLSSAQVCTPRWALSLAVLSVLLVTCTIGAFRYIMSSTLKRVNSPQQTLVTPEGPPASKSDEESFQLGQSLLEADFIHRLQFPGVAFGAGFLGGLLGLGGGIILGPVLLEVGMHSEVVQACTATFVLLSSSLATVQFARAGLVVWHYAVWYGAVTVVATWVGQSLCESFARKQKRYSFITLAIAGVLMASLVSLLFVGFRNVLQDFYMGKDMGFSTSRLCAGQGLNIIVSDAAPADALPSDLPAYIPG